ncbi:MAG: chemotaxis protein [Alphaproteobacteria bacterium]|nr:chemotaxis protein [Alphaproteobacteria bacterium]
MLSSVLKRRHPDAAIPGPAETPTNGHDPDLVACLKAMAAGDYGRIPDREDSAFEALRAIKAQHELRNRTDLERTVAFSIGASEAMAAASFVTGEAREVAENTQTIASAIDELNAAVGQIAESSNQALDGTNHTVAAIESSRGSIAGAIDSMDSVTRTTDAAGDRLRRLSGAVDDIGKILQTIDAISKQTNLLALNATIEAARAGEAGKGFAVVAGEVKQLANQTARATEDIQAKIAAITTGMTETLAAMDETALAVSDGRAGIHAVGSEIDAVVEGSRSAAAQISETASAVTEQSAAIEEVSRSLAVITQKTERTRENAEMAIASVGKSEGLIAEQLKALQAENITGAVLDFAKSDHALWKKKLAGMLVGMSDLTAAELANHHDCRLGKWYDAVDDACLKAQPAFRSLETPHEAVHRHGKTAAELFARGDRVGALEAYTKMETASAEVLALLDRLRAQGRPAQ